MSKPSLPPPLISWPLLPLPDASGTLHFPTLEESVTEQIRVILSTRPGEQLMRPGFGAGIENFVHEQNTLTTRREIRDAVSEALERWESRVIVDRVDVAEVPDRPSHVRVEIAYRLRRTGALHRAGLTVQLET